MFCRKVITFDSENHAERQMQEQNYCFCNKTDAVRLHSLFFGQRTFRGWIAELSSVANVGHWAVRDLRYAITVDFVSVPGSLNDTALRLSNWVHFG